MSNGNEQTKLASFGSEPKVQDPPTGFGDTSIITSAFELMPDLAGKNPYFVKKKFLEDQSFREEFSEKFFYSGLSDQQVEAYQQEDPEVLQGDLNRFKKNLHESISSSAYSGEPFKDTLISRTRQLSEDVNELPVEEYKEVIANNKKKYQRLGLLDENGEFAYNDDTAFSQKIVEDEGLHQQILDDRYSQFQDELGQNHNVAGIVKDDPAELTRSWVIYDKFGSEGLTQYMNMLQFSGNKDISESFSQLDDAKAFFQQASNNGKSPADYVRTFVEGNVNATFDIPEDTLAYRNNNPANLKFARQRGAQKGEGGFAKFDSMEAGYQALIRQINLDKHRGDNLKKFIYEYAPPSENNTQAYLNNLVKWTGATPDTSLADIDDDELAKAIIRQETGGEVNLKSRSGQLTFRPPKPRDELTKEIPEDSNAFSNQYYEGNPDGSVSNKDALSVSSAFLKEHVPDNYRKLQDTDELREGGVFSDEYKTLTYSVYEQATEGNEYNMGDLMDTVRANGEGRLDDANRPVYRVDYNNASPHTRIAMDALRHDPEFDYMFEKVGEGIYDFKPKRREENLSTLENIKNFLFDTTWKAEQGEDGEFSFKEVPEKGPIAQMWNTMATAGLAATDALVRYFFEPAVRGTNNIIESMGRDTFEKELMGISSGELEEKLRGFMGVDLSQGLIQETDGFFPNALGEAAPFIEYMGAMYAGGRGILTGTAKALQGITGVKKATDLLRVGQNMRGSSRLGAMGLKLSNALKNKSPWATGVGVFYTGGVGIETTQPSNVSFYETVPKFLGIDPTNDVTKLYRLADSKTKVAMDALGSLAMDFMFDTVIAGARFGGESLAKRLGKEEFSSIRFDQTKGSYVKTDSPQFHHDLRRFWSNFTNDLAELPMGQLGESMAKDLAGQAKNAKTLHDFTKIFTDDAGKVLDGVKNDIRENLEYLNKYLGDGVSLSDIHKTNITEMQYGQFLDNLSSQMYGLLRTSDDVDLPLRFAQALDEQVPVVREFRVGGGRVNPADAHTWRKQGYNLTVKDGRVYQVADRQWTTELASRIRQRALEFNKDRVVQRKLEENNFFKGSDRQQEQLDLLNNRADAILGTPVKVEGKMGYVTDWTDEGFTVKTSDGTVETGVVMDNLDVNQIINRKAVVQRMQAEKQGAFVEQFMQNLEEQSLPKMLGAAEPQTREAGLLRQIDEVDQRLNRVNRTREGIQRVREADETRGNQLRALSREQKELRQRKKDLQRELSEFYLDNPQLQNARRTNPEIVTNIKRSNENRRLERFEQEIKDFGEGTRRVDYKQGDQIVARLSFTETDDVVKSNLLSVSPEFQGQGIGFSVLKSKIDETLNKGKRFESDSSVTESAQGLYRRLEEQGYGVRRSENVTETTVRGGKINALSTTDGSPVFTVISKGVDLENLSLNQLDIFGEVNRRIKGTKKAQVLDADSRIVREVVDDDSEISLRLQDANRQIERLKETARTMKRVNSQQTELPFC